MGQIMLQQPGKDPRPMTSQELVQLIQKQQQDIKTLNEKVQELSKGPPYQELDNRARKIQMLEGLVNRLREELQNAKTNTSKEESMPVPTPPPVQIDPIQSISIAPSHMSKILPEVAITVPIVAL